MPSDLHQIAALWDFIASGNGQFLLTAWLVFEVHRINRRMGAVSAYLMHRDPHGFIGTMIVQGHGPEAANGGFPPVGGIGSGLNGGTPPVPVVPPTPYQGH